MRKLTGKFSSILYSINFDGKNIDEFANNCQFVNIFHHNKFYVEIESSKKPFRQYFSSNVKFGLIFLAHQNFMLYAIHSRRIKLIILVVVFL